MRLAVIGKGGAGKSLVAGTAARLLARRGHRVLALDSDPMPGLAINLGLGPLTTAMLAEAVEKDDKGRWRLKKGIGAARAVQRFSITAPDGVRLLQYGKATEEGLTPVLGSLNAFYQVAHQLARSRTLQGWTIIGDLPAGPRQTAFDWAPYADALIAVVEPTWQSILTVRRVIRIARERSNVEILVVANKVASPRDLQRVEERVEEPVIASVPLDRSVRDADIAGAALLDFAPGAEAVVAIHELVDRIEERRLGTNRDGEERAKADEDRRRRQRRVGQNNDLRDARA